jgi:large subunit ribosomal protein L31
MRTGIHPTYYPDAQVTCSCGHTWHTGSTKKEIRTDVCSKCHPFFTGEQRIVDTAGQVDRFMKRLDRYGTHQADAQVRSQEARKKAEQRFMKQQLAALELSEKAQQILHEANVITVGDLVKKLEKDKKSLLKLEGFDEAEAVAKLAEVREAFFADIK